MQYGVQTGEVQQRSTVPNPGPGHLAGNSFNSLIKLGILKFILFLFFLQATATPSEDQKAEIVDGVKSAIDIGYRHFDCAAIYNNEKSVGKAICDKISEGVIKRDEVYITSKVCIVYPTYL